MRTAVITGGSSGIGLAVARELKRRGGWNVVLAARSEGPLQAVASELAATAVRCDVTEDADVDALVEAARAAGGCGLLVHAAGAPARAGVLTADLAVYRRSFELNYIGLVRVATAFWPLLEASRGRLVPVVSVAGSVALAPSAPYASAKSAALAWARSYGAAAREHGVAVTIVNPGPVPTPGFPRSTCRSGGASQRRFRAPRPASRPAWPPARGAPTRVSPIPRPPAREQARRTDHRR
jgi:uncharacterized protein